MQIIPVLDLKDGRAVHAIRGERERYAPVQGVLGSGENALTLALAYRTQLGCQTCYVADLAAIAGQPGHIDLLRTLAAAGLTLWVDAGVSRPDQAQALIELGVTRVIIGSETLRATAQLADLIASLTPQRLLLSVDLKNGTLRAPANIKTPQELIGVAAAAGLTDIILLDLALVGAGAGPPLELLTSLKPHFPEVTFYAGGGVRNRTDLERLAAAGAAGALVGTAFHRGHLTAADLQNFHG